MTYQICLERNPSRSKLTTDASTFEEVADKLPVASKEFVVQEYVPYPLVDAKGRKVTFRVFLLFCADLTIYMFSGVLKCTAPEKYSATPRAGSGVHVTSRSMKVEGGKQSRGKAQVASDGSSAPLPQIVSWRG